MELKYKTQPLNQGGAAVPDCGTIHVSEIAATLTQLAQDLEFSFDLSKFVLGSTGKRAYSGDIDLVLDEAHWPHGIETLHEYLIDIYGEDSVRRNGSMVHLKYPIANFNAQFAERLPRTGYVQIDFNLGDVAWEQLFHYSPGPESEYKGAHRNLAVAAACKSIDLGSSSDLDSYDRPIQQIRWKWGPLGLFRVNRISIRDRFAGTWNRKQVDTVLEGPYRDAPTIASIIFPVDGTPADLNSLESVIAAVKRNYPPAGQERVWRMIASNVSDWKGGDSFIYPPEIDSYLNKKDK